MTRRIAFLLLSTPLIVLMSGCGSARDPWAEKAGPPRVVTSFAPLYCFAQNIAGEGGGYVCLCEKAGPHHYQFNHEDTLYLRRADVLIANGLGLDTSFTDKLAKNSDNATLRYVKIGNRIREQGGPLKKAEDTHGHSHGEYDPHLWLGIPQAKAMVNHIRDVLKEIQPSKRAEYDQRAEAYNKKLDELHNYGKEQLKDIQSPILTMHESLTYFADSFGLKIAGSIRVSPKEDADGKRMAELIAKCKKENIRIIAIEPQYSPGEAKTLKDELQKQGLKDVKLVMVDPLETCNREDLNVDWYVKKMKQNIDNLAGK